MASKLTTKMASESGHSGDVRPANALVVGDLMLDRYLEGQIHRISPEAPVPVFSLEWEWAAAGGAGNVAAALAGLGCRATVVGIVGIDHEAGQLRKLLEEAGVSVGEIVGQADLRTICKTRVIAGAGRHQVLRLDQDGDRQAFARASAACMERVSALIAAHDVVVLSDYDKGAITEALARRIISECRSRDIPCVVDPKKADFSAYAGATLLAPNVLEASRALGRPLNDESALAAGIVDARATFALDHLLITRGAEGMTLASADGVSHFPTEVREVADVTGAGDTVTATLAACLGSGQSIKVACRLASVAAGIAVGHRGCYIVKAAELDAAFLGRSPKIRDRIAASLWAAQMRKAGQKVVFTNGCFDLLHAGHLACLEQARRLGSVLVVGLNSDASVRCLKGPTRPVLDEQHRAALLAGLTCVDTIVVFDEQTPKELIEAIAPDVLVKGGDYAPETIVGADFVRARGGIVRTIPLVSGLSSTGILNNSIAANPSKNRR